MSTTEATADSGQQRKLDRTLAKGLVWTGGAKWGTQLLSWSSTIIVAKLLDPTDYGIMGTAMLYLALVQLLSEFGLGSALVQNRSMSREHIAKLGGLSVALGVVLCLISVGAGPIMAAIFDEPRVGPVITALSLTFIITSLQVVPNSLLTRDLDFRSLAFIEGLESLTQVLVTLTLAYLGKGYWSLVLGSIAAKSVSTSLMLYTRPHPLAWPSQLRAMTETLTFGGRVVISRIAWYVYSNADFGVIGKALGQTALGTYTLAWQIASMPVDKITAVVGRVTMPVFSAVQNNKAEVARYLLLFSEGLALITLPASIGLSLVTPDFVTVVLGDKWKDAILPLQALAAHVTFRCLLSPYSQALLALNETKQSVRVGIVQLLIMPAAFYIGARQWGIAGVAMAWLVVHPIITTPLLLGFTLRRVDVKLSALLRVLWPAISATGAMALAVWSTQRGLSNAPAALRLAAAIGVGGITYAATLLVVHRDRIRQLVDRIKSLRSRAATSS